MYAWIDLKMVLMRNIRPPRLHSRVLTHLVFNWEVILNFKQRALTGESSGLELARNQHRLLGAKV